MTYGPKKTKKLINPRNLEEKIVTRSLDGGGGDQSDPPSSFDAIHPID